MLLSPVYPKASRVYYNIWAMAGVSIFLATLLITVFLSWLPYTTKELCGKAVSPLREAFRRSSPKQGFLSHSEWQWLIAFCFLWIQVWARKLDQEQIPETAIMRRQDPRCWCWSLYHALFGFSCLRSIFFTNADWCHAFGTKCYSFLSIDQSVPAMPDSQECDVNRQP